MNVLSPKVHRCFLSVCLGPALSAEGLSCDKHGVLLNECLRSIAFFCCFAWCAIERWFIFRSLALFCCRNARKALGLFSCFPSENMSNFVVWLSGKEENSELPFKDNRIIADCGAFLYKGVGV